VIPTKVTYTKVKFYVGLVGAMVVTAVQFFPDGNVKNGLSALAAIATAVGVYFARNEVVEEKDGS